VSGGQIADPLADFPRRLVRIHCELVAPGLNGGLGFAGAQRREVLSGMAAAQFNVGGDLPAELSGRGT